MKAIKTSLGSKMNTGAAINANQITSGTIDAARLPATDAFTKAETGDVNTDFAGAFTTAAN
ncbi:hypothetical protein F5984_18805 [Rudanella paleaurantiibacter]|uniref:Uncharacterized protein n=2 Tax=Rudanella paleaurantiibacter TaxID=2614655 RepID=A0A7J5TW09_9BACT|nr:hypothetical protein F5984_18805 [Rudanella paleaurantiibacter]